MDSLQNSSSEANAANAANAASEAGFVGQAIGVEEKSADGPFATQPTVDFLQRALVLTARGIPVAPVPPRDKAAVLKGWPELATTNLQQLESWNQENSQQNTAAVAYAALGSFWMLDCDVPNLRERIEAEIGIKLPSTYTVKSSKGLHIYWKQTSKSIAMGNVPSADVRDKLFDAQVNRKYVVGPGSIHPSGVMYTVIDDSEIVEAPDALIDWIIAQRKEPKATPKPEAKSGGLTFLKVEAGLSPAINRLGALVETETGLAKLDYKVNFQCPFHDPAESRSHRSFGFELVPEGYAIFRCHHAGCDVKGDIIKLVEMMDGVPTGQAITNTINEVFGDRENYEHYKEQHEMKLVHDAHAAATAATAVSSDNATSATPEAEAHKQETKTPPAGTFGNGTFGNGIIKAAYEAKARALTTMKDSCVIDSQSVVKEADYIFRGFLTANAFCVAIGREKAEKSLFWLRFAMHMACGKDFCGYQCARPRRVGYLDAENGEEVMDFRRKTMLTEFTPDQQALIEKNLLLFNGQMFDMDYLNDDSWNLYLEKVTEKFGESGAEVHIPDCLYKFHNGDGGKASVVAQVVNVILYRLGYYEGKAVVLLNHTRGFSNDDLKQMNKLSLQSLGAQTFAQLSSGSKNLMKLATVVACQDRWFELDDEGEIELEQIHFQFYTRSGETSPLMKFDKTGDIERTIVRELTAKGRDALATLMKSGQNSWSSKNDAAKVLPLSRCNANLRITELVVKGYLRHGEDGLLHLDVTPSVARDLEKQLARDAKLKNAALWLAACLKAPTPRNVVMALGLKWGEFTEDILLYAFEMIKAKKEFQAPEDGGEVIEVWRLPKPRGIKKGSETAKAVAAKARKARAEKSGPSEPQKTDGEKRLDAWFQKAGYIVDPETGHRTRVEGDAPATPEPDSGDVLSF